MNLMANGMVMLSTLAKVLQYFRQSTTVLSPKYWNTIGLALHKQQGYD